MQIGKLKLERYKVGHGERGWFATIDGHVRSSSWLWRAVLRAWTSSRKPNAANQPCSEAE